MELFFLSEKIYNEIKKLNLDSICEIRLRLNQKIIIFLKEKKRIYLFKDNKPVICLEEDIKEIINNVTERSVYAFNDKIKNGFITLKNGIRIGISGECVIIDDKIYTIKNISSLNIRIPHKIDNCSLKIYNEIKKQGICNSLIISPPGKGKTTIIKDLIEKINHDYLLNILIIDERGEFDIINGENIDKIKFADKLYSFNYGIRSLAPDIVFTDELSTKTDWECVYNAVNSGVKIIATCHGGSIKNISNNQFFEKGFFDRYFVLDSGNTPGILKEVFDKDLQKL